MRPVTETHDYDFKVKNAKKFIGKGDKVKFTIRFKGRELQHSHLGRELMDKIKADMQDIGKVELHPKFDGKQMIHGYSAFIRVNRGCKSIPIFV